MDGKTLRGNQWAVEAAPAKEDISRGPAPRRLSSMPARVSLQGALGFLLGFLLLHPISMIIFMVLDGQPANSMGSSSHASYLWPFLHSFSLQMVPMGLVFGFVGAVIASVYGYQGATIACQRDDLLRQLDLNRRYRKMVIEQRDLLKRHNRRLAELERSNRRTALFMVHDFKTHLGCILGYSRELLSPERCNRDPEAAAVLSSIWKQAQKMLSSVSDLLDFARLTERPEIQKEWIDLGDLFQEVAADFDFYSSREGAKISTSVASEGAARLFTDPRLLRRLLGNLVFNALSHGKRGGAIRLEAILSERENEIVLSCRNEGLGPLPESLATLFQDFSTGSDAFSGSAGLGLAFCKTAAEALGGRIWLDQTGPSETCFSLALPQFKGEIQ